MAQVIPFPHPELSPEPEAGGEIDLVTAVDVAIRDLRDIGPSVEDPILRCQADECLAMLEQALTAALRET